MTITIILAAVAAYLLYRSDLIALLLALPDSNDDFDISALDRPERRCAILPHAEPVIATVIPAKAGIHAEAPAAATVK